MTVEDDRAEMRELERLFTESPYSDQFLCLRRTSKWGERIGDVVVEGIKQHNLDSIEDGLLFLEENPRYFRSGYFKASIASKLKRAPLTPDQRVRLRAIILKAVHSDKVGPEFNEYARLAVLLATPEFIRTVATLKEATTDWSRQRCERIISHFRRATM